MPSPSRLTTLIDVDGYGQAGSARFRLLYVCTGNICRSPFAEILTRHLLIGRLGGRVAARFDVSSAGTSAVVGSQMHPNTRDELMPWSLDGAIAGRFAARQLQAEMVRTADLVLGASARHRSAVVEREPAALATAFSLREFARLTTAVDRSNLPYQPLERAHALIDQARLCRGLVPLPEPQDDEIPDPMGRPHHVHEVAAELIRLAVETIIDAIAPSTGVRSP